MHFGTNRSFAEQMPGWDRDQVIQRFKRPIAATSMSNRSRISERRVAALLGLAFDADDGHKRITRGKNFLLAGGSEYTHGLMRDTILKVNEELDARGLGLAEVSADELRDLLNDAQP
jgi:hypothetical protein